jgi:hypothetical protein
MDIAIIGWGSLLRSNKALNLSSSWKTDGPRLPLEFAYVSKSKILTLTMNPASPIVQTPWAVGSFDSLETAIASVARLFRVKTEEIGFFSKEGDENYRKETPPNMQKELLNWLIEKRVNKIIWLDRRSNFKEVTNSEFTVDTAVEYTATLGKNEALAMEKYVISTPEEVETPLRNRLRKELGWRNLSVYREGFWLDKNTFIMCDHVKIEMIKRERYSTYEKESEDIPMLILENAVKMLVKNDNKILGEDKIQKFGIWLDNVKELYIKQQLWLREHEKA